MTLFSRLACRAGWLAGLLALAGPVGCATVLPPSPVPSAEELAAAIDSRRARLSSIRAQLRADIDGPSATAAMAQMLLAREPDQLRIDVMSPFGPTHTLASDGRTIAFHDRASGVVYRGDAGPATLARLTGVPLDTAVLVAVVRGLPPRLATEGGGRVRSSGRNWSWLRELSGGGRITVVIDKRTLMLAGFRLEGRPGRPTLRVSFDDYRDADGLRFPYRVEARVEDLGRLLLGYERVWRGVVPGDNAFVIAADKGLSSVDIEEMDELPGLR